jgi:hypothetical protein
MVNLFNLEGNKRGCEWYKELGFMALPSLKTKGHHACPLCMEQLDAWWSTTLGKMIYGHYRRELSLDHPFHMILKLYFDNTVEGRPLHHRCTTSNLMNLWVTIANNSHTLGMNMLSTLNSQLEYWRNYPSNICSIPCTSWKMFAIFLYSICKESKIQILWRMIWKNQTLNIFCGDQQNME